MLIHVAVFRCVDGQQASILAALASPAARATVAAVQAASSAQTLGLRIPGRLFYSAADAQPFTETDARLNVASFRSVATAVDDHDLRYYRRALGADVPPPLPEPLELAACPIDKPSQVKRNATASFPLLCLSFCP